MFELNDLDMSHLCLSDLVSVMLDIEYRSILSSVSQSLAYKIVLLYKICNHTVCF